jgi:phage shock protein A
MRQLFGRFWGTLRGRRHRVLHPRQDPDEQLVLFVAELDQQVRDLQTSMAAAIADEKTLRIQIDALLSQAVDWEERAVGALETGDEARAKEAVSRKQGCESDALALQPSRDAKRRAARKLRASLGAARQRVVNARREYTLALSRSRPVRPTQKLNGSLSGPGPESPLLLVEELCDQIQRIEAETEAHYDPGGEQESVGLDARFLEIERQHGVDQALAELKAKLAHRLARLPD